MSRRLFPHLCSIRRNVAVGTNGRHEMQPVSDNVACNLIPMSSRHAMDSGFTVGLAYDAYFPGHLADVKTGDQLVWQGETFNVRVVNMFVAGRASHKHALVTREGS